MDDFPFSISSLDFCLSQLVKQVPPSGMSLTALFLPRSLSRVSWMLWTFCFPGTELFMVCSSSNSLEMVWKTSKEQQPVPEGGWESSPPHVLPGIFWTKGECSGMPRYSQGMGYIYIFNTQVIFNKDYSKARLRSLFKGLVPSMIHRLCALELKTSLLQSW